MESQLRVGTDERGSMTGEAPTLGEIAVILSELKERGVTRGSIEYVINQVWWEEIDQREERKADFKKLWITFDPTAPRAFRDVVKEHNDKA